MAIQYLSPEEVAARLGLNPQTVQRWIKQGKIRAVKIGRVWRIPPDAIEEFLAQQEWSAPKPIALLMPTRDGKPEGLKDPLPVRNGKTLSDAVLEEREKAPW